MKNKITNKKGAETLHLFKYQLYLSNKEEHRALIENQLNSEDDEE